MLDLAGTNNNGGGRGTEWLLRDENSAESSVSCICASQHQHTFWEFICDGDGAGGKLLPGNRCVSVSVFMCVRRAILGDPFEGFRHGKNSTFVIKRQTGARSRVNGQ